MLHAFKIMQALTNDLSVNSHQIGRYTRSQGVVQVVGSLES